MSVVHPVLLPQLNVNDETVVMVRWLVEPGAIVAAGDDICIVETTKAATALAADAAGVLHPTAAAGSIVRVGERIALIGESADAIARALAETVPLAGSGAGDGAEGVRATPKAAALARDHGIALEAVAAGGVRGTIKETDVRRYLDAHQPQAGAGAAPATAPLPPALAAFVDDQGPVARHDAAVADSLRASLGRVLLATMTAEVDCTALNASAESATAAGSLVTPLHLLIHALGRVLPRYDRLVSFTHAGRLYSYRSLDIALVVRAPDGRLFTPVVRDVPAQPLEAVARACQLYGARAARNRLQAQDLAGAAFTVSHVNAPVADFMALPNLFQSAILAMTGQRDAVRARDGAPVVVRAATLTLTYDHAVADGQYAADFLGALLRELEAPRP